MIEITMKRAILICLTLLCSLDGKAFAQAPIGEGATFTVTVDTVMVLCRGATCSQPVTIKAGAATNCGYWVFGLPADPTFSGQCKPYVAPQPAVTITDIPCIPSSLWDAGWPESPVPIPHPRAVTWQCNGARFILLYSDAEREALWDAFKSGKIKSLTDLNAWRKSQPAWADTQEEAAFRLAIAQQYAPPPAPVLVFKVTPIAAGTRPFYKANSAGTGISTKLGNVAVGTLCDGTKRLGTTGYYFVPSVVGYAACSK